MAREVIDSVEKLEAELAKVKAAQKEFSTYTQEQVDKIFLAAAKAANMQRIPLAKMAVEETGMGIVEDKVIKNHYAAEYIYNKYKNTKTCGVIEEDKEYGTMRIAEPLGVIAAVIPTTNPTSTAIFKTLIALKTRNGIIISPHPRAKKSTTAAAQVVLDAAVEAGAPEGIISWIDAPSLDMTNLLMKEADIILATGGPGMVKAAYSSGKPALGVGAGNTPAIIDESADIVKAVNSIIHSKTFDNGMICASEQSCIVDKKIYKEVRKEFEDRGCYFLKADEIDKVRKTIIINGALNAKIVGQKPVTIAALAGVKIPEETKVLIGEVESVDISDMTLKQMIEGMRAAEAQGLDVRPYLKYIHHQTAFSFACISFILVAIPLGLKTQRRETNISLALALIVLLVYYAFFILGDALVENTNQELYPWILYWIPNLLFQGVGLYLLWRANRGIG